MRAGERKNFHHEVHEGTLRYTSRLALERLLDPANQSIAFQTLEQLTGALRALEIKLDEAAMRKLDEIRPGPGGAAPEAYAW